MISIINYGMGNIRSVQNALRYIGAESEVISSAQEILKSEKLVLPGVGSFRAAMENIRRDGLEAALQETVIRRGVPILGICLGMQIFAEEGEEDGPTKGLGWIRGRVQKFPERLSVKVPHIGFNTVEFDRSKPRLFRRLGERADFYFVHSYRMVCAPEEASCWAEYGEKFIAGVQKRNLFGMQFHPEKSQNNGLLVLKNFCELPF